MARPPRRPVPLPTKAQVLEFIQNSPGTVGKREIARAFHLDAEQRPFLREILKDLAGAGTVHRGHGRRLSRPGTLPDVAVIEVTGTDGEGELVGRPVSWDQETAPPRVLILPVASGQPAVGIGDRVLCRLAPLPDHREGYSARVVRRLGAAAARVLGVVTLVGDGLRLVPVEKRDRQEYVLQEARGGALPKPGALVEAEILPGRRYGLRPARVVEVVGAMDSPKAISLIAIHAHDIPTVFSDEALEQAASATAAPLGKRTDLRSIPLVTIDGADARDFDDAVWAEKDGDGWHLLVAIADVASYVHPGSPLDVAAQERGNSVYFPDRVVPMLPEALSNGWCSLKPHEERPCLAVHMWIDGEGNAVRHRFVRGLMQSAARLTYEQVQAALDGQPDETTAPIADSLLAPLYGAFKALRKAREKRGALEIEIAERKVMLNDRGEVTAIVPRASLDAHKLIEEFMVAANVAAAETLEDRRQPCMYRVHDEPAEDRLESLREFLATLDLGVPRGALRPQNFNHVLDKVKGTAQEHLVNQVVLRSQAQAVYGPENRGHFGLGLRRYAHFTSPIRRYADLLVHRALITGLGLGTSEEGLPEGAGETFAETGVHLCVTERRAAAAERDSIDRYVASFLSLRVGETFTGRVVGVGRFGLFVELDETGANGLIPISMLPQDYYLHDEATHALVGRSSGITHRLGDVVTVRLREANGVTGSLGLDLLEGGTTRSGKPAGPRPGRPGASSKPRSPGKPVGPKKGPPPKDKVKSRRRG